MEFIQEIKTKPEQIFTGANLISAMMQKSFDWAVYPEENRVAIVENVVLIPDGYIARYK